VMRKYGEEHPLVATILNNLAFAHKSSRNYPLALPLYQRSLGIRSRNLPPRHPDVVVAMNNLAECLRAMGEGEKADVVQRKMIEMVEAEETQETTTTNEVNGKETSARTQPTAPA
jgi:hypothetical protein